MTDRADWGLARGPGGGIAGVYSRSTARPLKTANFPKEYESFASAASYAEWRFVAAAGAGPAAAPEKPAPPGAAPALRFGASKGAPAAAPSLPGKP